MNHGNTERPAKYPTRPVAWKDLRHGQVFSFSPTGWPRNEKRANLFTRNGVFRAMEAGYDQTHWLGPEPETEVYVLIDQMSGRTGITRSGGEGR